MSDVIAVLCSDIHLCHTCPVARSPEPDWYEAMARVLDQVGRLADEHAAPIFCAGDVFDRWNSPPELINFAIDHFPMMIAVPGQHDLPNHSMDEIHRSAFWTLAEMEILDVFSGSLLHLSDPEMEIFSSPWGAGIHEQDEVDDNRIRVLLSHRYVWKPGNGYPGAPKENLVAGLPSLKSYDVAVFGDNHQSFVAKKDGCLVVNPGCLIPRKRDERAYQPSVYLLRDDVTVERVKLNISEDKWLHEEVSESMSEVDGVEEFIGELRSLNADSLDFEFAVRRYCEENKVSGSVKQILFDSIEG